MGQPTYASREALRASPDFKFTARDDTRLDRALAAGTRACDSLLHWAHFHPVDATLFFPWPNHQHTVAGRLWLDNQGLISLTSITSGGVAIDVADVLVEPVNEGPPFEWIDLDRDTTAAFGGTTGPQRNIAITGVWGYTNDTLPAGQLAEALDASETGVDVTDSSTIGVGSLIACEDERMIVTAKGLVASGETLGTNLAAQQNAETVDLTDGTAFTAGEEIVVDAERMLLVDIAGNDGIVRRAWNGSTLAAHTTGATIFAPRSLTVERGATGTTAATHVDTTALTVWQPPPLVASLCIAEAIVMLEQEQAAYGRTVGSGENERESAGRGLTHIRADARATHGRMRKDAI